MDNETLKLSQVKTLAVLSSVVEWAANCFTIDRAYTHTHIHTYTHARTHTHTHTHTTVTTNDSKSCSTLTLRSQFKAPDDKKVVTGDKCVTEDRKL